MYAVLLISLNAIAEPAAAPVPHGAEAMHRSLSARDGSPACEDLEALSETPVQALTFIVENATQPPWAGVRAAECLTLRHAEEIQPLLLSWVQTPETRGLALMVFNHLDQLPSNVALPVARASLTGPLAQDARPRLQKLNNPDINALIAETTPAP